MAPAATATARKAPAHGRTTRRAAHAGTASRRPVAITGRVAAAPRPGFAATAVGAISGIADSPVVLSLTRSRLWIGVMATLLVGIVALNVMALSFNAQSSETAARSDELREQNSALRADIADGLSNERLQRAAVRIGLVMPQAASALMLTTSETDAAVAARRLRRGELTLGSTFTPSLAETEVPAVDPGVPATAPAASAPIADPAASAQAAAPVTPDATSAAAPPAPDVAGGGVTP